MTKHNPEVNVASLSPFHQLHAFKMLRNVYGAPNDDTFLSGRGEGGDLVPKLGHSEKRGVDKPPKTFKKMTLQAEK